MHRFLKFVLSIFISLKKISMYILYHTFDSNKTHANKNKVDKRRKKNPSINARILILYYIGKKGSDL